MPALALLQSFYLLLNPVDLFRVGLAVRSCDTGDKYRGVAIAFATPDSPKAQTDRFFSLYDKPQKQWLGMGAEDTNSRRNSQGFAVRLLNFFCLPLTIATKQS